MGLIYKHEVPFAGLIQTHGRQLFLGGREVGESSGGASGYRLEHAHNARIICAMASADRKYIASASEDGDLRFWHSKYNSYRAREEWSRASGSCRDVVCLLPMEGFCVVATKGRTIHLFSPHGTASMLAASAPVTLKNEADVQYGEICFMQFHTPQHLIVSDGRQEAMLLKEHGVLTQI